MAAGLGVGGASGHTQAQGILGFFLKYFTLLLIITSKLQPATTRPLRLMPSSIGTLPNTRRERAGENVGYVHHAALGNQGEKRTMRRADLYRKIWPPELRVKIDMWPRRYPRAHDNDHAWGGITHETIGDHRRKKTNL